ncbi:hypothetical protein JXQ31_09590 [candidate division KSB1 bacterium]|nr:hypothetical protein [candidate division KSB1 bacterium]
MKKNFYVLNLFLFILLTQSLLRGQETVWQTVDPGGNGWLMFASIHPKTGHLYFSSDMNLSLLRSTDQGETWEPIANPVAGTPFFVAGDPKEPATLYMNQSGAAPQTSGIWRSQDNGDTWEHIYSSEEFGIDRGQSGLVDPDNNQILYWTAADMGVRRSTDGGFSWTDISQGLPKEKIRHGRHLNQIELDYGSPAGHRLLYYPTNVGLYQKEEPNGQWNLIGGLPAGDCSDVAVCDGGILYAALPDHGLFRSDDKGQSWSKMSNGLDGKIPFRVLATTSRPDIVYVATVRDEGVYGSRDGGKSFRLLTHRRYNSQLNWPINYRQHEAVSGQIMFIDPNDPNTVYMDYNKKTHDGGQTWVHYGAKEVSRDRWRGTGLCLLTDYRVAFDPNRPDLVWFGFSDTGLMLSEDRGESIINLISFHRGEVNQAAYWRDKLVNSSGSCVSMAVDPVLSTTIYASINGKNARNRASVGGIIIKSVDGGWNWTPVYEKNGLDDGVVRSIIIDPASPVHNRTVYAASYANGVYKSLDDGKHFKKVTPEKMFNGNTRIMWLEMAPSHPQTLYLGVGGSYGIRPITFGPDEYPALKPGMFGGIFKTVDGGKSWAKCNTTREIPSVQDIAVDPFNADIVYAAAYNEEYLLPDKTNREKWGRGGVYQSGDGGKTWELVFQSPINVVNGTGEVEAICINPVAPEIIYAAVRRFGIYRSLDSGKTWELVGQASMDRRQRRYHSIDLNPHDPAEVWVAHFGNSFSKGIDYKVRAYLDKKFHNSNFIRNAGFETLDQEGNASYWKVEQPTAPVGEQPVVSVNSSRCFEGRNSLRFLLTQAYCDAPDPIPAVREQIRLEKQGIIPVQESRLRSTLSTGETNTWVFQNIDPYFTTLMRGKRIALEMDVYIIERNLPTEWSRGSESGEIPRDPPQVYVTEIRDYNVHWLVAETSLKDSEPVYNIPASEMKGNWFHCKAIGRVSEDANGLRVTVTGAGLFSGPMHLYVDNIRLTLLQ